MGWGSASRPGRLYPGKDPVPIVQEAGRRPGPVWTGEKSRPHRDSIPDRPARSQWLCFIFPSFRAFPVCCSGIVWVILRWFQSLLLLPVSLLLSHSTYNGFPLLCLYILKYSQILFWSHFCLQELQHLLTCIFLFIITYYDVRFIVRNSSVSSHLLVP